MLHSSLLLLLAWSPSIAFPDEAIEDDAVAARAAVQAAGGRVLRLSQESEDLLVDFTVQGKGAGDDVLAHVAELDHVVELRLGKTKVTDAGLAHLGGMDELTHLWLSETAIGDAGLKHLAGLPKLTYLNLYGSRVTDAGLRTIEAMPALKRVYLWRTKVTEAGARELGTARPDLYVNTGWELKPPPKEKEKGKEKPKEKKGDAAKVAQTCCEKATAAGKDCDHPCCVAAAAKGELCAKCNPDATSKQPKEKG